MGLFEDPEICLEYDRWFNTPKGRIWFDTEWSLIESVLNPRTGERLLDVGCGPGRHLREWRSRGILCAGVDASSHMVRIAQERVGPFVPVEKARAEALPFPPHSFDTVVLIKILEFVSDPRRVLREARRVARKRLLLLTINRWSTEGIRSLLGNRANDFLFRHARPYTLWSLKRLVSATLEAVRISWASGVTEALFPGRKGSSASIGSSPFGDLLAVRVDLVQPCEVAWREAARLRGKATAWVQGAV